MRVTIKPAADEVVRHYYVHPRPFRDFQTKQVPVDQPCARCGAPPDHPNHLKRS